MVFATATLTNPITRINDCSSLTSKELPVGHIVGFVDGDIDGFGEGLTADDSMTVRL